MTLTDTNTDGHGNCGLSHGLAGALLITSRAAADSADQRLREHAVHLRELLARDHPDRPLATGQLGLLDGPDGVALALTDPANRQEPGTGWDTCLLTS